MALSLNELGIHVFAGCLFPDKQGAKDLMTKAIHPDSMHIIPIDVTDELKVRRAFEFVGQELSNLPDVNLHAIVNNAGIGSPGEIEWGTFDTFKQVFNVNTFGAVLVSRAFLPLIRQNKGRIVNVTSTFSRMSVPGAVRYSMSKCAALTFTEGLRRELLKFGVKVISVEPSAFKTPIVQNVKHQMENVWETSTPEVKKSYGTHAMNELLERDKILNWTASESLDPVMQSMRHAILATYPRYHYICANFVTKMAYYLQMVICPQEVYEFLVQSSMLLSRSLPQFSFETISLWLSLLRNCLTEILFRFLWPSKYLQDMDKMAVFITGKILLFNCFILNVCILIATMNRMRFRIRSFSCSVPQ